MAITDLHFSLINAKGYTWSSNIKLARFGNGWRTKQTDKSKGTQHHNACSYVDLSIGCHQIVPCSNKASKIIANILMNNHVE